MEQASLVVGEINPQVPRTLGDTLVNAREFDYLVSAELPPITFDRWATDPVMDKVAANVAVLVENGMLSVLCHRKLVRGPGPPFEK